MIPVQIQIEPNDFDQKVRKRGHAFLATKPNPRHNEWKGKDYWLACLLDLYEAYGGICAYCAQWIPLDTGVATVDHFEPKALKPNLAYEWNNYRLAASKLNSRKGNAVDVLDPFSVLEGMFCLDFPSLLVKPSDEISADEQTKVLGTIKRLKLNGESSVKSRLRWIRDYCKGEYPFHYLKRNAPFIGFELERQGIIENISEIMVFD
jgi:hypothetical protein